MTSQDRERNYLKLVSVRVRSLLLAVSIPASGITLLAVVLHSLGVLPGPWKALGVDHALRKVRQTSPTAPLEAVGVEVVLKPLSRPRHLQRFVLSLLKVLRELDGLLRRRMSLRAVEAAESGNVRLAHGLGPHRRPPDEQVWRGAVDGAVWMVLDGVVRVGAASGNGWRRGGGRWRDLEHDGRRLADRLALVRVEELVVGVVDSALMAWDHARTLGPGRIWNEEAQN